jgi:hypothetical protein
MYIYVLSDPRDPSIFLLILFSHTPATMTMMISLSLKSLFLLAIVTICAGSDYLSKYNSPVPSEIVHLPGHTVENDYHLPLPETYVAEQDLPLSFYWGNVNGVSYLTKSLNQHLPQ